MKIRWDYAAATLAVFVVELAIALFINDTFIRPHFGNSLAVVLVYLAIRTVTPWTIVPCTGIALSFAIAIELGQLFQIRELLQLPDNALVSFTLGGFFDLKDVAAYVAGALFVIAGEALRRQRLI
ncbi:DUF2809 domain-containing protein [Asticcacaulis sp. ZE23SCel15]|uniref:ribosomal maturation YjgA family protein n=1 Tax=Asticcacaulis sp. ZE23SCel15 TaxID=3059027 RepID=UPI00265FDD78|nr:DUF2809 domain-containing protein [Asticcacaulis sp. ZE23SCel15]WKL57533.1 DUF2809 domain-containing protein [Asticcacaulis sp. ZE23SCel15]